VFGVGKSKNPLAERVSINQIGLIGRILESYDYLLRKAATKIAVLQRLLSFGRTSLRQAVAPLLVWPVPVHCPFTSAAHSLMVTIALISRALHAGEKSPMCSLIHAAMRPSPGSISVQYALISTAQGRGLGCAMAVVPATSSKATPSGRIDFLDILYSPSDLQPVHGNKR
jgi:hypothetical protein